MDKNINPFNPGAGVSPPELAGRVEVLGTADAALARVKRGKHAKSLMILGLRGVGKTVLLNQIRDRAIAQGYLAEIQEAHDGAELKQLLIPVLRRLLLRLDRLQNTVDTVKKGIRVLRSFIGTITIAAGGAEVTLGGDPEPGYADSGNLEDDLKDILIATGEAARDANTPVAILIDELQYLSKDELGALIRGMHAINQAGLPLVLFGAGLPQLAGQAGDAKSYAERLFEFPRLGALLEADAWKAIRDPVEDEGASISDEALQEIFDKTHGYPYFLQEWGYSAWNIATGNAITAQDARAATVDSIRKLDESFFRVRFDRTTPAERDYMRCLAELGEGPQRSADVAMALGRTATSLGPVRDGLIKKGMVYSPEYGQIAFTVPLFDEFMRRVTAGAGS
ncbi:ATP-binding protein [Pigmentiphaga aceris]|uniref:ATP-binding protein n=1 Tax=Pigmentiphaga aceris TaxID=1940612 RepID=A0A5C0B059_9BURK|nr:ATP-binding protein [Pigmentiphaga aceris]QEI07755.1 ATP-binding protein [Pigmentiphaga aceris]